MVPKATGAPGPCEPMIGAASVFVGPLVAIIGRGHSSLQSLVEAQQPHYTLKRPCLRQQPSSSRPSPIRNHLPLRELHILLSFVLISLAKLTVIECISA